MANTIVDLIDVPLPLLGFILPWITMRVSMLSVLHIYGLIGTVM